MGLLGNILVTFVVGFWLMVWVASVMGMGAPGASNDLRGITQLLIMLSYPIWIFTWLIWSGKSFWGASPGYFLIGFLVIFTVLNAGMFRYAYNLVRGIQNQGYSVASNAVYFNAKPIAEADAQSFDMFKGDLSYRFSDHAWDDQHVYYEGRVVEGVQGGPLEALDDLGWSSDYVASGETVIYGDTVLRGCSLSYLEFFEDIEKYWARCGEQIYYAGNIVEGADAQSFTPLNSWLAHDKYRFYVRTEVTDTTADSSSFRRIDNGYYRDDHRVFYLPDSQIHEVEGADVSTFEVVMEIDDDIRSDARDSRFYYYNGKQVAPR